MKNNIKIICKILYSICILLDIAFFICLFIDYSKYDSIVNSAPFSAFIIIRIIEFILPSIIVFIIAKALENKMEKRNCA